MERLTDLLGFEVRYLVYPLLMLAVAGLARLVIRRYLKRWAARTKTPVDDEIVRTLDSAILPLLLIVVLYAISSLLPLTAPVVDRIQRGLVVLALILVVFFSGKLSSLLLEGLAGRGPMWPHCVKPVKNLSHVLFVLIGAALILRFLNVSLSDEGVRLVRIVGIIVGAYVLIKIVRLAVTRMEQSVGGWGAVHQSEAERRARTLGRIVNSFAFVIVVGVATTMVLSELGLDIMPIITGAGIAGLAVGFGAQNLVRDVISGFFLILEDQIRIGDVAVLNGTSGLVEAINLRTTILRDLEGTVHIFPNGEIKQVSNRTKEWSRYVIDVGVAYKEDVDYVMQVLKEIGDDLSRDQTYGPLILEPLQVLGVDAFGDWQVTIKISIKTLPLKQWEVGRELRRRIKKTFDEKGIEIPFPHLSLYFGEASKPFALLLHQTPELHKAKVNRSGSSEVHDQI